ncbi:F-box only protein 7 isoform X2 [Takifugu flavidus]|uniref:F-box only protein 7 n=1 Tax=Takifugu flavidus TaxID=433684 RepID=A0A5C6NB99_9TELE|nr:F-box only protein 7 isoform X2 [Takifugu flavidus]TWW64395.1 F-box only protein 7 [Takifugu flavidus]
MKLRVQVQGQNTRLELQGEEPSLTELTLLIRETVLPSVGLSAETEISLSLNGSEPLEDTGQTLASCGIVSGDLIRVALIRAALMAADAPDRADDGGGRSEEQAVAMATNQASGASADSDQAPGPAASCWEPMLCSETDEGQAPWSLELLYHAAQVSGPGDALVVAANLLMIETGFSPQDSQLKPAEMPAGWRCGGGVYKLQYSHRLCGDSVVVMVAVSMGSALIINGLLEVNQSADSVCKLCVDPSSYVTEAWPGDSAAAAFKELNKLSRVFKDQVAYPLITAARHAMALPVAFGLTALPPELLLRVFRLLDARSVVMLSAVCRHFGAITRDTALWRHLYCRDFRDSHAGRSRDTDWKELYRRSYKSRSAVRRSHECFLPPLYPNPRGVFTPPTFFPPVPGIIGGEYDQRPNFPFGPLPQGILPRPRYDPMSPFPDLDRQPPTISGRSWQPGGGGANIRRGFI